MSLKDDFVAAFVVFNTAEIGVHVEKWGDLSDAFLRAACKFAEALLNEERASYECPDAFEKLCYKENNGLEAMRAIRNRLKLDLIGARRVMTLWITEGKFDG